MSEQVSAFEDIITQLRDVQARLGVIAENNAKMSKAVKNRDIEAAEKCVQELRELLPPKKRGRADVG